MLFNVCEHYYSSGDIKSLENDIVDCFVCMEKYDYLGNRTVSYNTNINYIKQCRCDGWIHDTCVEKWFKKNLRCLICRGVVIRVNDNIFSIIRDSEFMVKIYIKTRESINNIIYVQREITYFLFIASYYCMSFLFFISIAYKVIEHFTYNSRMSYSE